VKAAIRAAATARRCVRGRAESAWPKHRSTRARIALAADHLLYDVIVDSG
jgi:hypothetical protein